MAASSAQEKPLVVVAAATEAAMLRLWREPDLDLAGFELGHQVLHGFWQAQEEPALSPVLQL